MQAVNLIKGKVFWGQKKKTKSLDENFRGASGELAYSLARSMLITSSEVMTPFSLLC